MPSNDQAKAGRVAPDAAVPATAAPAVNRDLLSLPRLGADVPRLIARAGGGDGADGVVALASALLRAGILVPTLPCDELTTRMTADLSAWAAHAWWEVTNWNHTIERGAPREWLPFWGLTLGYTNNISQGNFDIEQWSLGAKHQWQPGATVGGFTLSPMLWNAGPMVCTVGRRVQALQNTCGAGYDVLSVVTSTLDDILGVMSPTNCSDSLESCADYEYTIRTARDAGMLCVEMLEEHIPVEVLEHRSDARRIDSAVDTMQGELPWKMEVLHHARMLARGRDARRARSCCAIGCFEDQWPVIPICIRWCEGDDMLHMIDDHNEAQTNAGVCEQVWVTCWDATLPHRSPVSLRWAVRRLVAVIRTLARCHRILALLDDEQDTLRVILGAG